MLTRPVGTLRQALRLGLACAAIGCVAPSLAAQRPASQELVWPPPPEQPRIRYLGSLQSEADIGRGESFFGRLGRALVGREREGVLSISRPIDVWTLNGERFYMTDGATPVVFLFDREAKRGRLLGEDVPGGLAKPMGITGDDRGFLYVADQVGRRVVVFDTAGNYVRAFGGTSVLLNPVDVAVDREADRYYVVDSYLHQIVVFNGEGEPVQRIGRDEGSLADKLAGNIVPTGNLHEGGDPFATTSDIPQNRGAEPGEFRYPGFAAVGPDGTLYVTDQMNFRIQAFDRTGQLVRVIGSLGDGPGTFARPKGVAVDSQGHVYVADAAFNNVQIFDAEGRLLMAFGSIGHGEGQHWVPLGVSVDRQDRIYVADRYNNRAQIYQYLHVEPAEDPPGEQVDSRGGAR